MNNKIITISREFGSGGRTIGKAVARELGIPCYDRELIQKIATESGFDEKYIKQSEERSSGNFISVLANRAFGPTNEDYLWKVQCSVIIGLASKGACVIVGRCADYILKGKAECLRVFIHADISFRSARIVSVYGESELSPEQRVKEKDRRRAAYRRFYTDTKWGCARDYDLSLNSGSIGVDNCAKIIKNVYLND